MNIIPVKLEELEKPIILELGFAGENMCTGFSFACDSVFSEYPDAIPSMAVTPPKGSKYPVVVTRDGNNVLWNITDSDTAYMGSGEVQLIFTQNNVVKRSYTCRTRILKSILAEGTPPDPVQSWIDSANEMLAEIPETIDAAIDTAIAAAKASGEFKGDPGFSPVVTTAPITGGNSVTITDEQGEHSFNVLNGANGVSPDLSVTPFTGGHRITIVDASGTNTFDVTNGVDATPDLITVDYADLTFPVAKGATCYHNGQMFEAKVAIQTAEEWDSTKWDPTTVEKQIGSVLTAINGKMDAPETEGTSGQVLGLDGNLKPEWKTVSGGGTVDSSLSTSSENPVQNKVITKEINALKDSEAYTYTSITDGKYVKYADGSTPSLSGSKVIDFPVVENMKIKYSATIGTPDLRGLAYYDINGFYISGVQMLSTEQTITVPAKAVKCKATISNAEQIAIFSYNKTITDNVVSSASVDYVSELTGGEIITLSNGTRYNNATNNESSIDTYSGNFASAKVSCEAGDQFVYSAKYNGNSNYRVWAFYDSTGTKISDSGTIAEISEYKTITAPANAKTLYFDSMTNDGVTPFLCKGLYPAQLLESLTPSATNPFAKINDGAGLLSIFHTVGCIGDSLASGESAYKSGGTTGYIDQYPFSWGQCLARMTGNKYYNFSQGGLTTKTWLSSQFATDCFDGNHDCNAYFIGLGQNDKNVSMTVGTTEDINLSDYTQNADTYCGNYGKIIQKLKELQPKAKIFCFTDPNPPMDDNNYNNAVKAVVQLFDNCYLIDLYTYRTRFIGSSFIGQNMRAGHYNATGYQEIAKMIATYVDWFIRQNVSEFTQVEFIGTSYEWTT